MAAQLLSSTTSTSMPTSVTLRSSASQNASVSEKLNSWKLAAAVAGAVVGSTIFAILGLTFRRRRQRTRRSAFSAISEGCSAKGPAEILGAVRPNSLLHRTTMDIQVRYDIAKRKEVL